MEKVLNKHYVIVETETSWENSNVNTLFKLLKNFKERGSVDYWLIQDAVLMTQNSDDLTSILALDNVCVWVDDFSCKQKGLEVESMHPNIKWGNMEDFMKHIINPQNKIIWHA